MDYKLYNDYELIEHIRENDESSESLMLLKYQKVLHNLVHEFYDCYSNYGYYQEAMIAYYHAIAIFDEKKDTLFYTFMILCVRRRLSSFCRNISRGDTKISSSYLEDCNECVIEDVESNISTIMKKKEIFSIIQNVLVEFPIEISSILELHINGFTYREIAKLLDIPVSTVEFKSRKARHFLISKLKNYYCK